MAERSIGSRLLEMGAEWLEVARGGNDVVESAEHELLEAAEDVGTLRRDLRQIGYDNFNYAGHQSRELTHKARLTIVSKAWVAWSEDPQAGAAIDLRNSFVFGRGVPKPQCADADVQEVIDRTWKDPANRRILTSHSALLQKGVDLGIQSNVFFLLFGATDEESADGRIRLGLVEHDTVINAVRHPDQRWRMLYYKATRRKVRWDWGRGDYVVDRQALPQAVYYEVLDAFGTDLDDAVDPSDFEDGGLGAPPGGKLQPGKLYHLKVNSGSEMIFGVPRFKRLLRWFNAYEQIMRTSVDLMKAAASVYMKATTRGGRGQMMRASQQVTRRASPLTQLAVGEYAGSEFMPTPPAAGPSVLFQNGGIDYEPFKIDPHAADSAAMAGQARMQVAAGSGFPPHYTGDSSNSNLASATAVELPVLKLVEEEQEVWESFFRTFADLAIKRAVDTGWLEADRELTDDESALLSEGHEVKDFDPATRRVKRDLSYTFSLPNPLKRAMSDLVASATTIAAEFDPNNQNVPMQRFLFGLVLEQGFDIADPQRIVDEVYPANYEAPQQEPQIVHVGPDGKPLAQQPTDAQGRPTATGADGKAHAAKNPYGAQRSSTRPNDKEVKEGEDEDYLFSRMYRVLEEAAAGFDRGLPPRPDDPDFQQDAGRLVERTTDHMRELVTAAGGSLGDGTDGGAGSQ